MLVDLRMPGSLEAIDAILSQVAGGRIGTTDAVSRLLGSQVSLRSNRRLQAAMCSSRLPAVKTPEGFDFSCQPSIKREQVKSGSVRTAHRRALCGDGSDGVQRSFDP